MTRTYHPKPGTRRYRNYTPEKLENCVQAIFQGKYNTVEAAEVFSIPRKAVSKAVNERKSANGQITPEPASTFTLKKYGGQTVFSKEEEFELEQNLLAISDFGFPLTRDELRSYVRDYIQKKGKSVPRFRNNIPGPDWCVGFLNRHPILLAHIASKSNKKHLDLLNDPKGVLNKISQKNLTTKRSKRKRRSKIVIRSKNNDEDNSTDSSNTSDN